MSTPVRPRARISPRLAVAVIVLALAAWGSVLFWRFHKTPAQRHIDAGNEYARQGDGLNAVREWHIATRLDPDNAFAWQLLGQSYFEARQWQSAKEAFLQVSRIDPHTPRIPSFLASCFHGLGDEESALKYARAELKQNPNDIPALETCVAAQTRLGDVQEMTRCLRRLTELEPKKVEHHIALAEALIGQNNVAEVLPVADHILQMAPNDAEIYALRGIARFYMDGSPPGLERAEEDFVRSLSLRPGIYSSCLYLGRIYRRRGQLERAASFLEQAVKLNPKKADAFFDLAAVYERQGQTERAAGVRRRFQDIVREAERYVHLQKRCNLSPANFDLHLQVGLMALRREDLPAARYYLQKAYQLRPNDANVQTALRGLASPNALSSANQAGLPSNSPKPGGL